MTPNEYAELVIIADAMEEAGDPSRHLLRRIVEQVDGLLAELSRLRSSPAPVVGGVPVLDHAALWDLFREDYYTVSRDAFDKVMRFTVSQIASRLHALKPGEVEVLREIADITRPRTRALDKAALLDATIRLDKIRAQPTPTEKETGHA